METGHKIPYYLHGVGEVSDLTAENLTFEAIDSSFKRILTDLDINVIKSDYHEFPGGGLSVIYILSASHLAIHTWPEHNFMHFDLITCSPSTDFGKFQQKLREAYPMAKIKASVLDY
jgi:S-adenosylmethionine decarboxylase